jgi:putative membrane protein
VRPIHTPRNIVTVAKKSKGNPRKVRQGAIEAMMGFGFGMGGIIMVIVVVVVVGLCILFIAALFPKTASNNATGGPVERVEPSQSAKDIVKQRDARGEITKEQFEQMRRDLEA